MKKFITLILTGLLLALSITGCSMEDILEAAVGEGIVPENKIDFSDIEKYYVTPEIIESVSYDRYAYQHISDEAKVVYDQILDCMKKHDEEVEISTFDDTVLDTAYSAIFADYGGIFWVNGYQRHKYMLGDEIVRVTFAPKYTMTLEERNEAQKKVDDVVADWLSGISITDSDYDKAYYVFNKIVDNVDYKLDSENNQNVLSVFLNGESVCQGYANAVWYLLDELGINSTIIVGVGKRENHAWNLVYLDKAYYYMDATWGDTDYKTQVSATKVPRYAYMAITTEDIMQTHFSDVPFELPECVNIYDNYFVKNGRYYDYWDADRIGYAMAEALQPDDGVVDIMFSNRDIYNQAVNYFITESHIYDYLHDVKSVTYILDDETRVLTIIR